MGRLDLAAPSLRAASRPPHRRGRPAPLKKKRIKVEVAGGRLEAVGSRCHRPLPVGGYQFFFFFDYGQVAPAMGYRTSPLTMGWPDLHPRVGQSAPAKVVPTDPKNIFFS